MHADHCANISTLMDDMRCVDPIQAAWKSQRLLRGEEKTLLHRIEKPIDGRGVLGN